MLQSVYDLHLDKETWKIKGTIEKKYFYLYRKFHKKSHSYAKLKQILTMPTIQCLTLIICFTIVHLFTIFSRCLFSTLLYSPYLYKNLSAIASDN